MHLYGHERRSVDGQRGVRRRDKLGHGSAPQLFASNTRRPESARLFAALRDSELASEEAVYLCDGVVAKQRGGDA